MTYNLPNDGWLRLWRKLLTKRIWIETNPTEKTVMFTLLLMVNSEPVEASWNGKEKILKAGSMIANLEDIMYIAKSGLTQDELEKTLDKFESPLEFLKQEKEKLSDDPHKRLITILNWRQYQQDGLSNAESEKRKEDALKLYDFYVKKICPFHKSKVRAIPNIIKHSKKHSFKDLAKAVINYIPKAMKYDQEHRKDPANFFGIQEPYFKDFLPGVFDPKRVSIYSDANYQSTPAILTTERLEELNA